MFLGKTQQTNMECQPGKSQQTKMECQLGTKMECQPGKPHKAKMGIHHYNTEAQKSQESNKKSQDALDYPLQNELFRGLLGGDEDIDSNDEFPLRNEPTIRPTSNYLPQERALRRSVESMRPRR